MYWCMQNGPAREESGRICSLTSFCISIPCREGGGIETYLSSFTLKSTSRSTSLAARLICHSPNSPSSNQLRSPRITTEVPTGGALSLTAAGMPKSSAMRIHQLELIGNGTLQE